MSRKISDPEVAFRASLRRAGYKITPARLKVFAIMRASKAPLSVHDVIERIYGEADPVTIYRAMALLESRGLIRKVDLRHNHAHYELIGGSDHHHIICTECGRIEDIKGCPIVEIAAPLLRQAKFFKNIRQHSLEFFGICRSCDK